MTTTTIVIRRETRNRLAGVQAAMRGEHEGHVDLDQVVTRLLDRSDQLARLTDEHPEIFHAQ